MSSTCLGLNEQATKAITKHASATIAASEHASTKTAAGDAGDANRVIEYIQ